MWSVEHIEPGLAGFSGSDVGVPDPVIQFWSQPNQTPDLPEKIRSLQLCFHYPQNYTKFMKINLLNGNNNFENTLVLIKSFGAGMKWFSAALR